MMSGRSLWSDDLYLSSNESVLIKGNLAITHNDTIYPHFALLLSEQSANTMEPAFQLGINVCRLSKCIGLHS